ncbi:MAG: hypothetical protein NTZ85_01450, partial [Bacteroidia bacterium]|nr:hypothetical protein [Bacteroidia bacterium]
LRIVPENMITIARTHTQRALSVAEEGTSQVLFDLRNFGTNEDYENIFDPNSGSSHYLTSGDIISLINGSSVAKSDYITNPSPPSDESFETSYQAKIKVISNDTTNKILDVDLYTLGTVYKRNGNELARKAIKTSFKVNYLIVDTSTPSTPGEWVPGEPSKVVNYALFSGNSISFSGNAQTVDGDIHAIGLIDLGSSKQIRVENGNAETEDEFTVYKNGGGTVDGKKLDRNSDPPAPQIDFPIINIDNYSKLADAFRNGDPPYDGNPIYDENGNLLVFANTSNDIVKSVIQSYLGAPETSSPIDGINNFYLDLINGTGDLFTKLTPAQFENLRIYMGSIVYYVQGPATINGQFACAGTLVVDGDLSINGGATVGDPSNPGGSAILVKGNIIRSNGNADLYGFFYSTGSVKGVGTFDCEGSVITQGSMDLKGTYKVKYVPLTWNPNIGIGAGHWTPDIPGEPGEPLYSVISAASGTSSYSWKEISYEAFNAGN